MPDQTREDDGLALNPLRAAAGGKPQSAQENVALATLPATVIAATAVATAGDLAAVEIHETMPTNASDPNSSSIGRQQATQVAGDQLALDEAMARRIDRQQKQEEKGCKHWRAEAGRALSRIGQSPCLAYGWKDSSNNSGHLVCLIGDAGAGKSSLMNSLHLVLRVISDIVPGGTDNVHWSFVGQGNGNGTGPAEFVEFAARFAMVDTRGYAQHGMDTANEITEIATSGIADRQDFVRNGTPSGPRSERRALKAKCQVGGFCYVHNATVDVTPAIVDSYRAAVRGNQKPLVVLTHVDKLSTDALAAAKSAAMQAFGVSVSHLFAVQHIARDPGTGQAETCRANEIELLRLVATMLTEAERDTPPKDIDTDWIRVRDWISYQTDLWRSSTPRKLISLAAVLMILALFWAAGLIVPPSGLTVQDGMIYCAVTCALFYAAQQMLRPDVARN